MTLTFSYKTARDLLRKLEREATDLKKEVSADKFSNFVVTAYSLIDWIKNDPALPNSAKSDVQSLYANQNLKICGDIANSIKHFKLDKRKPITQDISAQSGYGMGRYGVGKFGIGETSITIKLDDGSTFSVLQFTDDVLMAWNTFFTKHSI